MSHWTESLYARMPVFLQNAACSYYGLKESRIRFGKPFQRKLHDLTESEFWSAAQIESYQNEQLRRVVEHAYAHVPFYRERMRSAGLAPADIRTVQDLPKLPVLTKDEVRAGHERMLSEAVPRKELVLYRTSGTTGKSLHFYVTRDSIPFRWAVWWRHRLRFGAGPGEPHVNFTGKRVVPIDRDRPPYWRRNRPMNQILLNMHHLVPGKVGHIARFLDGEPVRFYSGYPSVVHAFARALIEEGIELQRKPEYVFTGAENMLDFQRADIQRVTGAVLSDQYGFAEGCGNASHCPQLVYHEDFEYGILECVDPTLGDEPGTVRGRIVATGFASHGFPFLRYEVGDVGVWAAPGHRCACGRESRVLLRIEGRMDDYVVTPEGRRIMRFDYLFKDTVNVQESQIVQREPGAIIIRIVRGPHYSGAEEREIEGLVHQWISPRLRVRFEYLDRIPREANGKFRAVRSELPREAA